MIEKTDRGCPQGGVLSPLLWSVTVDDLLPKLSAEGYNCFGYADDLAISHGHREVCAKPGKPMVY